ncbi:RHS repeat-associated core domain-containing protein [Variovorax humicola]|uniref:RHS repeat-associated core domain-containing protein n=1 Tax=Variovorax humicola TaxID=1769758 RepID=A0ABU8W0U6_9BURK
MPIDIASGNFSTEFVDIDIPGKVALTWSRSYSVASIGNPPGALGRAWTHCYAATLTRFPGGFRFVNSTGGVELVADPNGSVEGGGLVRHLGAFLEIFMHDGRYVVQTWNVDSGVIRRHVFSPGEEGLSMPLASLENVSGMGLDLQWNEGGQLLHVHQRLEKRQLVPTYDESGLIVGLSVQSPDDGLRVATTYEYDAERRLAAVYDAAGFADRLAYDDKHRITREVYKDGGVFRNRYDAKGRCVLRTGLAHFDEKRMRYLDAVRMTEVTDSYGACTRFQYLPTGQVISEWGPEGEHSRLRYDEHGRIVSRSNALEATTQHFYDASGNRDRIVDALGHTHQLTFNAHHQAIALTDPRGQLWTWDYDERQQMVRAVDPLMAVWIYTHDASGNLIEIENPEGRVRRFGYVDGVRTRQTDWASQVTELAYDGWGRLVARTDPLMHTTRYTYDQVGNLVDVERPDGSHMQAAYDAGANVVRFSNEAQRVWTYQWSSCQRMVRSVDPNGNATDFAWGTEPDRLVAVRNQRGETHRFVHDLSGRCVEEIGFDERRISYTFDAAGWCVGRINGMGESVAIHRDLLGQIVGQTLPGGEALSFVYDPMGEIVQADSPDCVVRLERDAAGRLLREVQQTATGEHWVAHTLDAMGEAIATSTDLGLQMDHQLDENSRWIGLRVAQEHVFEFWRDACGNETARSLPGGIRLEQRYDRLNRLVAQRARLPAHPPQGPSLQPARADEILVDRTYARDPTGLVWGIVNAPAPGVEYEYDPAEQLLKASRGSETERFRYDPCGNIVEMTDITMDYLPGNRLLRRGDTQYQHDAEGRLIGKIEGTGTDAPRAWSYRWNALDQLVGLTRPDGATWAYAYDAFGRRVGKSGPEQSWAFVYDGPTPIHEMRTSDGHLTSWIFGPGRFTPLARQEDGKLFAVIADHLGTPTELIDLGDHSVSRCLLSAYGQTLGASGVPFRFQGQYFDEESGLHYNRFRYYDPATARFVSPDPTGLQGGYNLYQYAPNPVAWIDPWGLCRRGNQATQDHMDDVRDRFLAENPGFELVAGGRLPTSGTNLPEQYLPPLTPGTGRKGSSFVDMRFVNPDTGQVVHVQTVDPQASGPSGMTPREATNADRISRQDPTATVVTVNKGSTPPPGSLDVNGMNTGAGVVNNR